MVSVKLGVAVGVITIVMAGVGLSSYYAGGGAKGASAPGSDGSFWLAGEDEATGAFLHFQSEYVGGGSGNAGSDYQISFQLEETIEGTSKVTYFKDNTAFTYVKYGSDGLEMTDCVEISPDMYSDTAFKSTGFSLLGEGWTIELDPVTDEPTQFGAFNVLEFGHGTVPDEQRDVTGPMATGDLVKCKEVQSSRRQRRLTESRRLDDTCNYDTMASCPWYDLLFNTQDFVGTDATITTRTRDQGWGNPTPGQCVRKTYANTDALWVAGDDDAMVCRNPATEHEVDVVQLWGTNNDNDIINDIDVFPANLGDAIMGNGASTRRHSGVDREATDVINTIPSSFIRNNVIVSGFSLGGATAHQVAAHYKGQGKSVLLITGGEFASMGESNTNAQNLAANHYRIIAQEIDATATISCLVDMVPSLGIGWTHQGTPLYVTRNQGGPARTCHNQNGHSFSCSYCSAEANCVMPCACNVGDRDRTGNNGCQLGQCYTDAATQPHYTTNTARCTANQNPLERLLSFGAMVWHGTGMGGSRAGAIDGHTFNYKLHVAKAMCGCGADSSSHSAAAVTNFVNAAPGPHTHNPHTHSPHSHNPHRHHPHHHSRRRRGGW